MTNTITLYRFRPTGEVYSSEGLQLFFEECQVTPADYEKIDRITAHLTTETTIFPYYYTAEDDTFFTAMDLYRIYAENKTSDYSDTFGAFIGQSRHDSNCRPLYGFRFEVQK